MVRIIPYSALLYAWTYNYILIIRRNMKKNIFKTGLMVIAMAAAASCSGYLDEDLKSSLAPDNTYTSSMGFETGCNGLYSIARSEYNTWGENGAYMHGAACAYEALQIATDIVDQNGAKDGSLTPFADLTLTAATKFVGSYWNWAYNLIASANEIMIYADKNTNWDYPEDKQIAIATARFFRAYAYRTLVYLYGDVPWVETIENPFKLSFTRTPKVEVLGHVIDDFTFAAENLPTNPDKVKTGKLTCWAAYHLLSEMYNFRGHLTKDNANFEEAAKCALKVIDSKYFALNAARFGASKNEKGDAFSDMFQENNQNRTSGNTESIWVMQFEYQTVGGGTNSDDWTRRAWNPQYFAINGFALADSLGGRGLAQISPMKWWIGTKNTSATQVSGAKEGGIFEDGDMRNSKYNIKRDWYYNNPLVPASLGKKSEITDKTWATGQLFPALTKFFFGKSDNLQLTGSYKDRMKCRLGETYLHLAEAYLGMGDAAKAAEALNVIRKRAKVRNLEASEVTVDELLDERIREMVGEESRKFTLVRMGADVYVNRVKKYNPSIADQIDEHFALWPVPQEIRDANRGSEFPQNPGYGE